MGEKKEFKWGPWTHDGRARRRTSEPYQEHGVWWVAKWFDIVGSEDGPIVTRERYWGTPEERKARKAARKASKGGKARAASSSSRSCSVSGCKKQTLVGDKCKKHRGASGSARRSPERGSQKEPGGKFWVVSNKHEFDVTHDGAEGGKRWKIGDIGPIEGPMDLSAGDVSAGPFRTEADAIKAGKAKGLEWVGDQSADDVFDGEGEMDGEMD